MLERALKRHFGFDRFLDGQQAVIERLVKGESAAAIFPTGAGKSLCYQLPALLLPHLTLVVSPLLSLMKDQVDVLKSRGIAAERLDSTLPLEDFRRILDDARAGRLKILMVAVERFRNERFRAQLSRMKIDLMAVDEAHCISEWGHNFRPEYLKLPDYRRDFAIPAVLLLTATATPEVAKDMCGKFGIPPRNVTATGFYRKNLALRVTPAADTDKEGLLLERLGAAPEEPTIVYVTLQKTAERVAGFLAENGISAAPYHAGMGAEDREAVQNRFMNGGLHCVVATIAFGMGIDKRDIRRVVHFDLPKSIENYSQEIGRAGRDGQPALCEVLANRDGVQVLENFVYGDTPEPEAIRRLIEHIQGSEKPVWEAQLPALSRELDLRLLPLKTLLVYLEMEGILRPRFVYHKTYAFRYRLPPDRIAAQFDGERQVFARALLEACDTKKVWTYLDVEAFLERNGGDRRRVASALDYFDEKGWIELGARQAVEVYDITDRAFEVRKAAEKLHRLFASRETREIGRVHDVIAFLESGHCLSKQLAAHFGDPLDLASCGHCSVCREGPAVVRRTADPEPLDDHDVEELTQALRDALGKQWSTRSAAKFLCGITTPTLAARRAKNLPHFGRLENHPFPEVLKWVGRTGGGRSRQK